jgi:hypothetical protein
LAARLAESLCALERFEEAARYVAISREAAAAEDVVSHVVSAGAKAKVFAHDGDHAKARSVAQEAVALADGTDALNMQGDALMDLAVVERMAGRPEQATSAVIDAMTRYDAKGNVASLHRSRALPARIGS